MGTCLGTFRTHSDIMGSKCLSRTRSQGFTDNTSPVSRVTISHTVLPAGFMPQERGSPVRLTITVCGDTHMCLYFQGSNLYSSSFKTSLRFNCIPPFTLSLYSLPPLLASPSPETFCSHCFCPGCPQHRGRASWGLFRQPWD